MLSGKVALGLAQVLDLRRLAVEAGLEDRIEHQVRIRVRSDGANFDAHALLVADRNADHGAAIHCGRLDLIRRFKVRIEAPISIHAGIQQQADVVAVREDAVDEGPSQFC